MEEGPLGPICEQLEKDPFLRDLPLGQRMKIAMALASNAGLPAEQVIRETLHPETKVKPGVESFQGPNTRQALEDLRWARKSVKTSLALEVIIDEDHGGPKKLGRLQGGFAIALLNPKNSGKDELTVLAEFLAAQ
jgi:hypothetical protein